MSRFEGKITGVAVHIGDENYNEFGLNDKRCLIEVRPAKNPTFAGAEYTDTMKKAYRGAI
ncbi:MAG: hypothetical protein ACRC6O_04075 [Flavobacterium sp.]